MTTGNTRVSVFEADAEDELPAVDLSVFKPKAGPDRNAPSVEAVRQVAEKSNFPSRERQKPVEKAKAPPKPRAEGRVKLAPKRRTERTEQFNNKVSLATVNGFTAIANEQGWTMAETIEQALAALQKSVSRRGKGRAGEA